MTINKKPLAGTDFLILDERLSSLCKVYHKDENHPFAQFYVQTGELGEAIIKGLDSPSLNFRERKVIHKAMWSYVANVMGYKQGTMQRVKFKPEPTVHTVKKSLGRYKK